MQHLNVGLVGAGFMGKAHSLAYACMPMFFRPAPAIPRRAVIADVSEELARDAALHLGFERSTADWREVVDDPTIDIVDIATPNDAHAEVAIAAARAGKHILCEKPLARNAAEARRMLEAVEQAGVVHMVAFNYRRTPAVVQAKRLIEEGAIGRVLRFHSTYWQEWAAEPSTPLSWRFQRATAGSGALGDIGTHALDIARYLVGEVVAASAVLRTHIVERPLQVGRVDRLGTAKPAADAPTGPVDVDDEVVTTLRFASGALGTLSAARNAWGRYNWPLIVISRDELHTLPLGLSRFQGDYVTVWNEMMAGAFLALLPTLVVFLIFQEYFVKGVVTSGIKG